MKGYKKFTKIKLFNQSIQNTPVISKSCETDNYLVQDPWADFETSLSSFEKWSILISCWQNKAIWLDQKTLWVVRLLRGRFFIISTTGSIRPCVFHFSITWATNVFWKLVQQMLLPWCPWLRFELTALKKTTRKVLKSICLVYLTPCSTRLELSVKVL